MDNDADIVVVELKEIQVVSTGQQGPAGPIGPPGPAGGASVEYAFAYGDASPHAIVTALAGKIVYEVDVIISIPFNGTGASVVVGDAGVPNRLQAAIENDVFNIGSNKTSPVYIYGVNTAINVTITPGAGASQGAGLIRLMIQQ